MKLKDQVALITGSSRGIGRSIALLLAKEGAKIVANHSKSPDEALSVVTEITKLGSEAIAIECDVSDEEQVKKMIDQVIKRFAEPEEIAEVALFLVADESRYINGTTIMVDGGNG